MSMTHKLVQTPARLELHIDDQSLGPIYVDFLNGALAHRRQYGGGRGQLIAKAIGIKPKTQLSVIDATAGLGRDAFILALLGCNVTMCERSPVIYALLNDGLQRARQVTWFQTLKLVLHELDGKTLLAKINEKDKPDVIYLDPMFPERTKSALVKKEMRALKAVVGDDLDAAELLNIALKKAKKRVVVKRSKLAPTITDQKPDLQYKGKSSRFDVYLIPKSEL